jgi:hypothetical protein
VTVILDELPIDDDAGMSIGNALGLSCGGSTVVSSTAQSSGSGIVDPNTGAPLVGAGNLLVTAGGPNSPNNLVAYLESQASPVYFSASGEGTSQQYSFIERGGGTLAGPVAMSAVGASQDYFVIELVRAPTSSEVSLVCYGFTDYGTQAGSWWLNTQILPSTTAGMPLWTVMKWTATAGTAYAASQFSPPCTTTAPCN